MPPVSHDLSAFEMTRSLPLFLVGITAAAKFIERACVSLQRILDIFVVSLFPERIVKKTLWKCGIVIFFLFFIHGIYFYE